MVKLCSGCNESKDPSQFVSDKTKKDGLSTRCKECRRRYYNDNREYFARKHAEWSRKNAEHVRVYLRNYTRQRRYGVSPEQVEQMLASQGGACAICRTTEPGGHGNTWHVDHNHTTGDVRGVLCSTCNTALGQFRDSPEILLAAIRYLLKGSKAAVFAILDRYSW